MHGQIQSSETVPLIFKNDVNVALKSNKKITWKKNLFGCHLEGH
jgi:hypothetical protein